MSRLTWLSRPTNRSTVASSRLGGADEARQLAADLVAVAGVVEAGAGDRHDPGLGGQLAVAVAEVEGGKQLADGQVAGAAEDHEVARGHGDRAARCGPEVWGDMEFSEGEEDVREVPR